MENGEGVQPPEKPQEPGKPQKPASGDFDIVVASPVSSEHPKCEAVADEAKPDSKGQASPAAPSMPVRRVMPPWRYAQIQEIRKLALEGNIREVKELSQKVCQSFNVWGELFDEGRHNFMKDRPCHPLTSYLLAHPESIGALLSGQPIGQKRGNRLKMLELGPGIGNDAVALVKGLDLLSYHAVEASEKAAEICRGRLQEALATKNGIPPDEIKVAVADFMPMLQSMSYLATRQRHSSASLKEDENRRLSEYPNVILSISSLYHRWPDELEKALLCISNILRVFRGKLVFAIATKDSETRQNHKIIHHDDPPGFLVGLHEQEGMIRSFGSREAVNAMLQKVHFDFLSPNTRQFEATVEGYNQDGAKEEFYCVIVQPKEDSTPPVSSQPG